MNRRIETTILALLLLAALPAPALETGLEFRMGNIHFPWDQADPTPAATTVFPATNYFYGGEAWVEAPLGEDASFRLAYERDPILRNGVSALVQFERGIARIAVGPRVGLFNTAADPFSAGLSSAIRLQWPGVAYVSMLSDGGLSLGVLESGADPQARVELAAGLYIRNAILSAVLQAKRFNELDEAGDVLITDSWTRYALEVEMFKKNVPYTLACSVGYEQRSRRYAEAAVTDSLGAVILGIETSVKIMSYLTVDAGLDTGIYVFGLEGLQGRSPSTSSFMFSAGLGLSFDVDEFRTRLQTLREARKAAGEAEAKAAAEAASLAAEAAAKAAEMKAAEGDATPATPAPAP